MTKMRRRKTLLLCVASVCTLALSVSVTAQDRAKQIGGKFMCMCTCNQVLTQCNHVGCTTSTAMLKELDQAVARGDSEDVITQRLVQEFGTKVGPQPRRLGLAKRLPPGRYVARRFHYFSLAFTRAAGDRRRWWWPFGNFHGRIRTGAATRST